MLQRYNVNFDPLRFEESGSKDSGRSHASNYALSLIPLLISKLSETEDDTNQILKIVSDFANSFGLSCDLATQKYVEFLLTPPSCQAGSYNTSLDSERCKDVRLKLNRLENTVQNLLRRLQPPQKRARIVRACLVDAEKSGNGIDYERLSVVLALYQAELRALLSDGTAKQKIGQQLVLAELELIDRRRDALAILSSYFQGERKPDRPIFSLFFAPLPEIDDDNSPKTSLTNPCSVLGSECSAQSPVFDPLRPLEGILHSHCNAAATSALAPLCLPLGVPRGHIHARSLIARFMKSKAGDFAFPSFEGDVLPVLNRLKSTADKAELAEWCSNRFSFYDGDKLKCLDLALTFAMQASSEAELSRRSHRDMASEENERKALDRVKRISTAKDLLADRLALNSILCSSHNNKADKNGILVKITEQLLTTLEAKVWDKEEFLPEKFIDILLTEASFLAANACLDRQQAISTFQFRQLSSVAHRACKSIADKYSHAQVGACARRLTRRWLFHGDEEQTEANVDKVTSVEAPSGAGLVSSILQEIDEEDTCNFVMDLANLRNDDNVWSADIGSGTSSNALQRRLVSEEEPSCLRMAGSARELSERGSQRVALRIAFVMAFADGYHSTADNDEVIFDENSRLNENRDRESSRESTPKARVGLLSKISSKGGSNPGDSVLEHSRELMQIVFARSGASSEFAERDLSVSFDSRCSEGRKSRKTITFAMRHRALRAAAILCPQEGLEEAIKEGGFLGLNSPCTLKKCAFGVFVAKEIEEMRLPLPHSDLCQLSTMHFPSYARALWRHHRDGDLKGSKGRLLLLILEMLLKDRVTDAGFVESILNEMQRLNLPRTLLLACECMCSHKENMDSIESVYDVIHSSVSDLLRAITSELQTTIIDQTFVENKHGIVETLNRLGDIIQAFCDDIGGQENLIQFIESLMSIIDIAPENDLMKDVSCEVYTSIRRLKDKDKARNLLKVVASASKKYRSLLRMSAGKAIILGGANEADPLADSLRALETSLCHTTP